MRKVPLLPFLIIVAAGSVGCASRLPMPRYSKVWQPPLELHGKKVAVVHFDGSKAQVAAGKRTPDQVNELKTTSGPMLAETIAVKARARLNTPVDSIPDGSVDGYEYVIKGKVIQVDPGDANLRAASGLTSAVLGIGGGGGGGAFQASGEIYKVEAGGKLNRIAEFEHKADIDGGTFTSDGDMIRAGTDRCATLIVNFLDRPRDNNQVN